MWIQEVGRGALRAVAFAPDGRTLYTGDEDRFVFAWDLVTRTGRELSRIPPQPGDRGVDRLWPASDPDRVYVLDWGGLIDALSPKPPVLNVRNREGVSVRFVTPDRRTAFGNGLRNKILAWDIRRGTPIDFPGPLGAAEYLLPVSRL